MKLNLEDRGVFEVSITVEQARSDELPDDIITAIDEAQGFIFSGEGNKSYVVIEITK